MSNSGYESNYGSGVTGSHPTMAGNMLDPNIQSDGNMSGGPGVGGTSERHVREEGAEHIRQNPGTTSSSVGGGLGSASGLETTSGLGSSSNLGSSSGLGSTSGGGLGSFGEGGVSGTGSSYNSSSGDRSLGSETTGQTSSGTSGGVIGSALSYLGLGGKSGEQSSGLTGQDSTSSYTSGTGSTGLGGTSSYEPQTSSYGQTSTSSREPQLESSSGSGYGSNAERTALGGAGLAGVSSGLGSERETSSYGGQSGDRSYGGENTGLSGTSSGLGSERDTSSYGGQSGDRSYGGETSSGVDSNSRLGSTRDEVASRTPADNDVTTGSDPLESAVPKDTDTADTSASKQSHEAKLHDKHASTRENVDAIPTAGGEKLGAKHWGESKIVPENPKPQAEAGVSSKSNQFSNEVRDNTNRNTGPGAHPTGTGAHGKESMVDKMKDKLHLGNSLGSSDAA